jgi:hypothetical protein
VCRQEPLLLLLVVVVGGAHGRAPQRARGGAQACPHAGRGRRHCVVVSTQTSNACAEDRRARCQEDVHRWVAVLRMMMLR